MSRRALSYCVFCLGVAIAMGALLNLDWYSIDTHAIAPVVIQKDPSPTELASNPLPGFPDDQLPPGLGVPDPLSPVPLDQNGIPLIPPAAVQYRPPANLDAWQSPGTAGLIANAVLIVAALGGLALAGFGLSGRNVPPILLAAAGTFALAAVIYRMAAPPDELKGHAVEASLDWGIFIALLGAVVMDLAATVAVVSRGTERASVPA